MGSYCPGLVRVNHFNRMSIVNDPILQYLDILVMDPTKVREIFATLQRGSGTWDRVPRARVINLLTDLPW